MNPRRTQRESMDLTQPEAASRAKVSLATWRRWEEDPEKVSAATRASCERVLDRKAAHEADMAVMIDQFEQAWGESPYLTPRQAYAIAATLDWWAEMDIQNWLDGTFDEPLHEIGPFGQLDSRVMILVNENRAWAAKAQERCFAVADEIGKGVLPFDRPGCYFDELLMALALVPAEEMLTENDGGFFDPIAARVVDDAEQARIDDGAQEDRIGDENWSTAATMFDDKCRWDEWQVPVYNDHSLLAAVLAERHPYTWFDPGSGTDAGYLRRLTGTERAIDPSQN